MAKWHGLVTALIFVVVAAYIIASVLGDALNRVGSGLNSTLGCNPSLNPGCYTGNNSAAALAGLIGLIIVIIVVLGFLKLMGSSKGEE